jgi:hypothetical protein
MFVDLDGVGVRGDPVDAAHHRGPGARAGVVEHPHRPPPRTGSDPDDPGSVVLGGAGAGDVRAVAVPVGVALVGQAVLAADDVEVGVLEVDPRVR